MRTLLEVRKTMDKKIAFFIDNDFDDREMVGEIITSIDSDIKVREAVNGDEAISILETTNEQPDLIILDLNMPKVGGLEFLNVLKCSSGLCVYNFF